MPKDDKTRRTKSDKAADERRGQRRQPPDEYRPPTTDKEYDLSEEKDTRRGGYDPDLIDDNRRRAGSGDQDYDREE